MDRRRFVLLSVPWLYINLSDRLLAQRASNAIPPPSASARLDLSDYATQYKKADFITSRDKNKSPQGIALMLGGALMRSEQVDQGWFLLSKDGIITSHEYKQGVVLWGFGVTTGMTPVDGKGKPTGHPQPVKMSDLIDPEKIGGFLRTTFEGADNKRVRAITFWVTDVGKGQVQSDNTPSGDEWDKLLHEGDKSPPISILDGIEMVDPHIFALVYEFERSPMKGMLEFRSPGRQSVESHLRASDIWKHLGL